jgi:hypothetical protein
VLALLEGYMKQTTIENPMRPDEYMAKIAYSNGHEAEAAHPMDRGQIGAYVDKRLKAEKAAEKTTPPPPAAPPAPVTNPAPPIAGPVTPPAATVIGQPAAPIAQ